MTTREEIAGLRLRITGAESQRDVWRASGRQEKYLEACSLVDALELQLVQLGSVERSTPTVAPVVSPQQTGDAAANQMAELCIRYNGKTYGYRGYRYDLFVDAVNYARLDRARGFSEGPGDAADMEPVRLPTPAERGAMQALGITFKDGVFRWREFRYDRLADALAYATLEAGRPPN